MTVSRYQVLQNLPGMPFGSTPMLDDADPKVLRRLQIGQLRALEGPNLAVAQAPEPPTDRPAPPVEVEGSTPAEAPANPQREVEGEGSADAPADAPISTPAGGLAEAEVIIPADAPAERPGSGSFGTRTVPQGFAGDGS